MKSARLAVLVIAALAVPLSAEAIPSFARRYQVTCATCHAPAPRLNAFGELFAANGFAMAEQEGPTKVIETGDPLLRLLEKIDFAMRLEGFVAAGASVEEPVEPAVDFQVPWTVKVLSGGKLSSTISYYMYFLVAERGEVAGLEDAYLQFTNLGSTGINLIVGQFQVSDPLFKRELRLQYEDYHAYRVRVGVARADLTYDRGFFATWSPWETGDLALMLVSGQGLNAANPDRQYDNDIWKNVALRFSQDLGQKVRLGVFGYLGNERSEGQSDRIIVFGPDASLNLGRLNVNVQLLRRLDSNPMLEEGGGATRVDSAMVEVIFGPFAGDRWYVAALYNWISANDAVISLRLGEQETPEGYFRRYHTASLGLHYLLWRNMRLVGEAGWDIDQRRARIVAGGMFAF